MEPVSLVTPETHIRIHGIILRSQRRLRRTLHEAEKQRAEAKQRRRHERRMRRLTLLTRERRIRRRLARAYAGLENLLALGATSEVQQLIATCLQRPVRPYLSDYERSHVYPVFYTAYRPSGDAWEGLGGNGLRACSIRLFESGICLTIISGNNSEEDINIPQNSSLEQRAGLILELMGSKSFIPTHDGDARLARDHSQRKWEWEPAGLLFQVLVDCVDTEKLQRYFNEMLDRF